MSSVYKSSGVLELEWFRYNLAVHPGCLRGYLLFHHHLLLIAFLRRVLLATTTGVFELERLRYYFSIYPWLLDILRQLFKALLCLHHHLLPSSSSSRKFKLEGLWHNFPILPRLLHSYLLRQLFQVFSCFNLLNLSIVCFSDSGNAFLETLRCLFRFSIKLRRGNPGFESTFFFRF